MPGGDGKKTKTDVSVSDGILMAWDHPMYQSKQEEASLEEQLASVRKEFHFAQVCVCVI
jgi:hypothetical protein